MVVDLIPNVEILEARVHAHDFISSEDAAWCAIRSLLFSHVADKDFQAMYHGELAIRATDHALNHGRAPLRMLGKSIWEFEKQKRYATAIKAQYEPDLVENLPMVKAVLSLIYFNGMGLNQAFETVDKYNRVKASQLMKAHQDKEAQRYRGKGAGTLRKQWARFGKVMPCVLAELIKEQAVANSLSIQQLRVMPLLWQDTATKRSITKKISVGMMYAIDFY